MERLNNMRRYLVTTCNYERFTLAAADENAAIEAVVKLFGDNILTIAALRRTKRIENIYASVVVEQAMQFYTKMIASYLGK